MVLVLNVHVTPSLEHEDLSEHLYILYDSTPSKSNRAVSRPPVAIVVNVVASIDNAFVHRRSTTGAAGQERCTFIFYGVPALPPGLLLSGPSSALLGLSVPVFGLFD